MTFKPLTAACAVMSAMQARFQHVCDAAFRARAAANNARDSGRQPAEVLALERRADALAGAVPIVGADLSRTSAQFSSMLGKFPASNDERYREPEGRA